jgi:hypothetical protein
MRSVEVSWVQASWWNVLKNHILDNCFCPDLGISVNTMKLVLTVLFLVKIPLVVDNGSKIKLFYSPISLNFEKHQLSFNIWELYSSRRLGGVEVGC